jgi:hypothetical protein
VIIFEILVIVGVVLFGILWWVILPIVFLSWLWNSLCDDIGSAVGKHYKQEDPVDHIEAKRILAMIKERQSGVER